MNNKSFFLIILFFPIFTISQNIPTIYSHGGMSPDEWEYYVDETMENFDSDGPDFVDFGIIENPCSQGVFIKRASSTLAPHKSNNYDIENIQDYNHKTAWVEGKSDYGIGEYFIVSGDVNIIYNGYQKSEWVWQSNSRVKKFKVYKDNKPICYLKLHDLMGGQYFSLPEDYDTEGDGYDTPSYYADDESGPRFKFEIVEVYEGDKWKDVAITHIDLQGCCLLGQSIITDSHNNYQQISKINKGDFIKTMDLKSGKVTKAKVNQVFNQKHYALLEIKTKKQSIKATKDHPFYVKNYGLISLREILKIKRLHDYNELSNQFEILVWNETKNKTEYEIITQINIIEGEFETYTILDLENGQNFIANGFVTSTY